MDLALVRAEVASRLPKRCGPLLLTFRGEKAIQKDQYVGIGSDEGTELCLDLSDGSISSIDPEGEHRTRFVNSGIEQLARSVEGYREYGRRVRKAGTEEEEVEAVRDLRDRLATIDPRALADPENWWALVVEQAEDGLM